MIRNAVQSDAQAITDLTAELGYPIDLEVVRERIERISRSLDHVLLVASVSNTVSGWIQASTCDTLESGWRVEIIGLVVSATCRRTGIGKALVAAVEEWAKKTAATTIIVRSNVQRSDSHSFYPAIGYEKSKTQHLYKKTLTRTAQQDARVDALTRATQR